MLVLCKLVNDPFTAGKLVLRTKIYYSVDEQASCFIYTGIKFIFCGHFFVQLGVFAAMEKPAGSTKSDELRVIMHSLKEALQAHEINQAEAEEVYYIWQSFEVLDSL